jgi:topoisomerase-4 subunit B
MGKNTPDRQQHIIRNLRIEKDTVEKLISEEVIENEQIEQDLDVA